MNRLSVYTDSSFDHNKNIAACGFVIISDSKCIKHQVFLIGGLKNSTHAEGYAIYLGVKESICFSPNHIDIYTDCQTLVNRKKGGQKKKRKKTNPEWDIWIEVLKTSNITHSVKWIKGHSSNEFNIMVDKSCRKHLREYIKGTNP